MTAASGYPIQGRTVTMPALVADASTATATYSYIEGVPHRTRFVTGAEGVGFRLGGAELSLGDHAIATELRRLGLPRRALMTSWMERMHGRFEAPEKLRPAARRQLRR